MASSPYSSSFPSSSSPVPSWPSVPQVLATKHTPEDRYIPESGGLMAHGQGIRYFKGHSFRLNLQ